MLDLPNLKMDDAPALTAEAAPPPRRSLANYFRANVQALNVLTSWSSNLVLVAGSFIVTPALIHGLGSDHYGVWLLLLQFTSYVKILDLGMTSGCMKYTAGSFERGDRVQLGRVYNTSLALFGGSALLALLATGAMALILPQIYPTMFQDLNGLILATGLGFVIDLMCRPFASSLRARSFFFVYDSIEIVAFLVFKFGLVLYLAHLGLSLRALALLTLTESLVRNGAVLLCCLRFCPWTTRPNPFRADRAMMRTLIGYSGAVFLMSVADLLRFGIDSALIARYVPDAPRQIAVYVIAFRLIMTATTSIGVIWAVLVPRFSGLYESGRTDEMWALHDRSFRTISLLTVFSLVNIGVFGLPFLKLWLHQPWVGESYRIMLIALPAYLLSTLQGPANGVLAGSGKLRLQTLSTFAEAFIKILLCVALVPLYGIYGVLLSTVIPMLLFRGLVFPWLLRAELGVSLGWYYGRYRPVLKLMLAYIPLIIGFAFLDYSNLFQFALGCIASTLIFGLLLGYFEPGLRAQALRRLKTL